ncbi:hypothetical protein DITRI_Ditri09bG0019600 [Diplodiscus trichospermus]
MGRKRLWDHLSGLQTTLNQKPWLLAGDFNITTHPSESSTFDGSQRLSSDSKDFLDCIQKLSISDHVFSGPFYTWSNHQTENFLARKLDKVLVNDLWIISFTHFKVEFLPLGDSDRCPSFIQLNKGSHSPPKPFKFFNFWARHPQFLEIVDRSWREVCTGSPQFILHQKLKKLKPHLRFLNKHYYADISLRVKEKKKKLEAVQLVILSRH